MSIELITNSDMDRFAAGAKKVHIIRQNFVDFELARFLIRIMTALSNAIDCAVNIVQGVRRVMDRTKNADEGRRAQRRRAEVDMGSKIAHVMASD